MVKFVNAVVEGSQVSHLSPTVKLGVVCSSTTKCPKCATFMILLCIAGVPNLFKHTLNISKGNEDVSNSYACIRPKCATFIVNPKNDTSRWVPIFLFTLLNSFKRIVKKSQNKYSATQFQP